MEMRVVRQKVRADGTPETEKDLLDWLKFAQSETTGIKVGFPRGEVAELDAQIDAAMREAIDEEVNRRLAAREVSRSKLPPCREMDSSANELHGSVKDTGVKKTKRCGCDQAFLASDHSSL